ncbi:MAG: YhbY family RNA-binding protein [Phycisphaerales bacterium]|nr:YhbY family RNA-binding protein [Phycisphaerales bacterium]MBT7171766.1 YhbY family RNA-binding protein [Phycisphaerales bacterium]
MELSGKEKKALRAVGQTLAVGVQVGRSGITEGVLGEIDRRFEESELVKVKISESGSARKQVAEELENRAKAVCVGLIGRSVLLYRAKTEE